MWYSERMKKLMLGLVAVVVGVMVMGGNARAADGDFVERCVNDEDGGGHKYALYEMRGSSAAMIHGSAKVSGKTCESVGRKNGDMVVLGNVSSMSSDDAKNEVDARVAQESGNAGGSGGETGGTGSGTSSGDTGDCDKPLLLLRPWYAGLTGTDCKIKEVKEPQDGESLTDEQITLNTLVWGIVTNVLYDLFVVVGYLATGFIIYAGYLYLLARGESSSIEKAKKTLIGAISGLIIAILAAMIVSFISSVVLKGIN